MKLDQIVAWGRSFDEYRLMFNLTADDLKGRILGCGDGPASFNAELSASGGNVISCDPIYGFNAGQIAEEFDLATKRILAGLGPRRDQYVWSYHKTPEMLWKHRRATLDQFLADYEGGKTQGRYVTASLPTLPFDDGRFDLALCSHLLFLYSDLLDFDFHARSLRELCRVAKEVRIFPLMDLQCEKSTHLESILKWAADENLHTEIVKSGYEFQRNGNEFLRLRR